MRRKATPHCCRSNKFLKIITLPFRVLGMAGDVYVRGLTNCTRRRVNYAPSAARKNLPKSFSAVTEDFRELMRAASGKSLGVDVDVAGARNARALPKSISVGMRRIDEDEPCEFGDDEDVVRKSTELHPRRSRSCAVRP